MTQGMRHTEEDGAKRAKDSRDHMLSHMRIEGMRVRGKTGTVSEEWQDFLEFEGRKSHTAVTEGVCTKHAIDDDQLVHKLPVFNKCPVGSVSSRTTPAKLKRPCLGNICRN